MRRSLESKSIYRLRSHRNMAIVMGMRYQRVVIREIPDFQVAGEW